MEMARCLTAIPFESIGCELKSVQVEGKIPTNYILSVSLQYGIFSLVFIGYLEVANQKSPRLKGQDGDVGNTQFTRQFHPFLG